MSTSKSGKESPQHLRHSGYRRERRRSRHAREVQRIIQQSNEVEHSTTLNSVPSTTIRHVAEVPSEAIRPASADSSLERFNNSASERIDSVQMQRSHSTGSSSVKQSTRNRGIHKRTYISPIVSPTIAVKLTRSNSWARTPPIHTPRSSGTLSVARNSDTALGPGNSESLSTPRSSGRSQRTSTSPVTTPSSRSLVRTGTSQNLRIFPVAYTSPGTPNLVTPPPSARMLNIYDPPPPPKQRKRGRRPANIVNSYHPPLILSPPNSPESSSSELDDIPPRPISQFRPITSTPTGVNRALLPSFHEAANHRENRSQNSGGGNSRAETTSSQRRPPTHRRRPRHAVRILDQNAIIPMRLRPRPTRGCVGRKL